MLFISFKLKKNVIIMKKKNIYLKKNKLFKHIFPIYKSLAQNEKK